MGALGSFQCNREGGTEETATDNRLSGCMSPWEQREGAEKSLGKC